MKTVLVRYRVREDMAGVNEALIQAVFDELRQVAPAGLQYQVYRQPDGCSFVHLAEIATTDGSNPLVSLDAFRRFQQALRERCTDLPVVADLTPIASYAGTSGG